MSNITVNEMTNFDWYIFHYYRWYTHRHLSATKGNGPMHPFAVAARDSYYKMWIALFKAAEAGEI